MAFDLATGQKAWSFTAPASGGTLGAAPTAIASTGAVVSGGMVFISTGYGILSGASSGNILLAFAVE